MGGWRVRAGGCRGGCGAKPTDLALTGAPLSPPLPALVGCAEGSSLLSPASSMNFTRELPSLVAFPPSSVLFLRMDLGCSCPMAVVVRAGTALDMGSGEPLPEVPGLNGAVSMSRRSEERCRGASRAGGCGSLPPDFSTSLMWNWASTWPNMGLVLAYLSAVSASDLNL